jgi:phage shock protein A
MQMRRGELKTTFTPTLKPIKEKVEREKAKEEMRRGSENREVKWKSPPRADTYADEERRIENNIHSRIEALKETTRRENVREK